MLLPSETHVHFLLSFILYEIRLPIDGALCKYFQILFQNVAGWNASGDNTHFLGLSGFEEIEVRLGRIKYLQIEGTKLLTS